MLASRVSAEGRGLYGVKVEDAVVEERVRGGDLVRCWKWRWLAFVVLVGVRVREGRSGEGRGRSVRGSCCGAPNCFSMDTD